MAKSPKRSRYSEEIKRIRQLSTINKVLKKGDVENAFLNSADKDTENISDSAVERMLADLRTTPSDTRDVEVIDSLVKASERKARPSMPSRSRPRQIKRASAQKRRMPARPKAKMANKKRRR